MNEELDEVTSEQISNEVLPSIDVDGQIFRDFNFDPVKRKFWGEVRGNDVEKADALKEKVKSGPVKVNYYFDGKAREAETSRITTPGARGVATPVQVEIQLD